MRVQEKSFYADMFSKGHSAPPPVTAPTPPPPSLPVIHQTLQTLPVPAEKPSEDEYEDTSATAAQEVITHSPLFDVIGDVDIHNLSPRQMTRLSQDLYAAGAISFEDYSLLAFQPELHPEFDRTIGALTGERADPDRRRDFVSIWSERAAFERRHNNTRPDLIEQSERIVSVLKGIETPTNLTV